MRPPTNQEIIKLLSEMVVFYEMDDVPFKPQAYERVVQAIETLDREVADIYNEQGVDGLRKIPGVGEGIAYHLELLIKKGTFLEYEKYKKKIPVRISELLAVEGLGAKTIKTLYQKLKIKNLADLEKAATAGKIQKLPHFGAKSEEKILKGIEFLKKSKGRFTLGHLLPIINLIENRLRKIPGVQHVTTAGSVRRMQDTVGDIDILVTAKNSAKVMEVFVKMPEVEHVYGRGLTKTNVRLNLPAGGGIDADVRVVPEAVYGAALQYFTGSKEHNIEVRKLAIKKGYKLSEYGLFRGKKLIAAKTEEDVYKKLGLIWIPPEIRTASGEIEAALRQAQGISPGLPNLIPYGSIRGDLQIQTNWTDGANSLEEMVKAAMAVGLEYIAITDHTRSLAMTGGLDEKGLARQAKEIDRINKKLQATCLPDRQASYPMGRWPTGQIGKLQVLKSAEVNVLKDGKLDIADEALKKLDLVSMAIHSHFHLSEKEQTERIIRAIKHPLVNIFFHPTGRVIGRRPAYALDMAKILRAAKEYGVAMEINSFPDRLDLKDTHIRQAVEIGVKLVIDSDAHSVQHFAFYNLGIGQARRGWATKKDVLNTLPCGEFLKAIKSLKK